MIRITIEIDGDKINVTNTMNSTSDHLLAVNKEAQRIPHKLTAAPLQESKVKSCAKCGKIFTPQGPRQKYCSEACGMQPKPAIEKLRAKQKGTTLTPGERERINAELDATLAEIEAKRSQPYKMQ